MTRAFAILFAAMTLLAGAGRAHAEEDIIRPSSFFGRGGSSPIPRTTVMYESQYSPGTIVVNTAERRLYLVLPSGQALRYGIGVGRDGFRWGGVHRITAKKEWPEWTPPPEMLARRRDLPRHMKGGIDNPLERAITRCISARRSIAFTARTSRRRSARRYPPAASA